MTDRELIEKLVDALEKSAFVVFNGRAVALIAEARVALAAPVVTEDEFVEDVIDDISKALRKAWQLGQTYWQQADSDLVGQHKMSDKTQAKFEVLLEDTQATLFAHLRARPAVPEAKDTKRLDWMQKHLLRDATIRLSNGDMKAVNAWAISSADKDLRGAIDAVIAAALQPKEPT